MARARIRAGGGDPLTLQTPDPTPSRPEPRFIEAAALRGDTSSANIAKPLATTALGVNLREQIRRRRACSQRRSEWTLINQRPDALAFEANEHGASRHVIRPRDPESSGIFFRRISESNQETRTRTRSTLASPDIRRQLTSRPRERKRPVTARHHRRSIAQHVGSSTRRRERAARMRVLMTFRSFDEEGSGSCGTGTIHKAMTAIETARGTAVLAVAAAPATVTGTKNAIRATCLRRISTCRADVSAGLFASAIASTRSMPAKAVPIRAAGSA